MRALLVLVLTAALLWGGYWFLGARTAENAAEAWFAGQKAQGWVAEKDSLSLAGFPSRFDLTVEGLHLADPDGSFDLRAPFVQILSLSYTPWHLIAALPNAFDLGVGGQNLVVSSSKMQASLVMEPKPSLPLSRFASEADAVRIVSDFGWVLAAERLRFATRQDPARLNGHEIGLEIKGLRPDPALVAALDGTGLPEGIETAQLSMTVGLSAPLDRFAEANPPQVEALAIKEGLIRWGDLVLFVSGSVVPDANGLAEGRFDLRVEQWRKGVLMAQAMGLIPPQLQQTVETMVQNLAEAGGDPEVLNLPLVFAGGRMSLGPLPLGVAPRLH